MHLHNAINLNFHDLNHFKSTFSAAALGMINSGWVWLVADEKRNLEVVATFGAGTLLVRSRSHMKSGTLPIVGESIYSRYEGNSPRPARPISRAPPSYAPQSTASPQTDSLPNVYNRAPTTISSQAEALAAGLSLSGNHFEGIGDVLTPLLCVSVQEHAWVGTGYGVWGKEEYLKRFWSVVNWQTVSQIFERIPRLNI